MASISTLEASSSNSNPHSYEVFLNFRGEDTRKNFIDHLYNTLIAYGIRTFRDDEELEKGEDIRSGISKAIEGSNIFIIIFSKSYATSKWCLNELVKIIEYSTPNQDNKVVPIFYHAKPSDVGQQSGSFEDAFFNHEKDANQEKKEMIKKWRIALEKAAKLSGYHVDNQHEAEVIQKIREVIITRLNRKPLYVGDNIVGMDFHLKQLESLIKIELDDVRMVGIYGIGGIGKTTIAMAIYNDISSQFDGSSFLRVVGEKSKSGLLELQKKLLEDTLKGQSPKFNDPNEGINVIKERLCLKRVLIVLDDVDEIEQLENLAGKHGWYGAKSIIIITTKDTSLLNQHGVDQFYEVKELNQEEATELFNWWAFKQNIPKPKEDFESLSNCVVKYAKGLPIALKVLGGFLFGKKIDEWKSALHKLEKIPHMKVQSVLKVSYDRLDDVEKEIFLDIACFFKGRDKDFVSRILGRCAEIGIKVLHERCLITISENKVDMHNLLQQMGQEIVRQECLKEPGKRSRLWDPNDVYNVLARNMVTQAIEGLFVKISSANQIQFSTYSFTKMNRLRLLKVYYQWFWSDFEVDLPKDLEFPSFELSYFHFEGYPLESLPTNFHTENLVELDLLRSSIKQLWKGNEILDNLRVINLSYSKDLVEIPDFASVPNLEILILIGCTSLESLPRNFHKLEHLQSLSCERCLKLKSFPKIRGNMSNLREINLSGTAIIEVSSSIEHLNGLEDFNLSHCKNLVNLPESICNLSSLETLNVQGCSSLKGFPEIKDAMENLVNLDLSETNIEELPYSIGHLKALKLLDLSNCKNLVSLPESICNLSSLETLNVRGCSNLMGFPEIKDDMKNLVKLDLSKTGIQELPCSIGHLKALKLLDLLNCKNLVSLPESICNLSFLETLNMWGCLNLKGFPEIKDDMENLVELDLSGTDIKELPYSIGHLKTLKLLTLSNCENLVSLPESICNLSSLETLKVCRCSKLERTKVNLVGSLHLTCCILKQGVIWRNDRFSSLKTLNLQCNQMEAEALNHHIFPLSSLVELSIRNSRGMERGILSDSFHLSSLKVLSVGNFNPMARGILSGIFYQSSLESLSLYNCNLMEEGIPTNIWNLSSLVNLSLSNCNLMEGDILNHICHLSSLEELSLNGNHFSSIPAGIGRLSNLKGLNLSHCKKLRDIPELPSSLLFLDAHCSDGISSSPSLLLIHSLFNHFKSELIQEIKISVGASEFKGKGMSIVIPRSSGMIEGIRNQSMGSDVVTIELPQNWYQNSDLLGFALCCVYVPVPASEIEYETSLDFYCKLTIQTNYQSTDMGEFSFASRCDCCDDDNNNVSDQVWVIYYPKDAIKGQYLSNQRTQLMASFNCIGNRTFEAEDCGIHLIYVSCVECQRNEECQQKLCLKGKTINELPFIECPFKLGSLCLRECKNLESLPSSICELKSLTILSCSGCSQLKSFPEIRETLENLRELRLDGTAIEELPSSIQHLRGLQYLNLAYCNNLVSLPETICHLKSLVFLSCLGCSQLKSFPEILENMENLRDIHLDGTAIKELPTSIQHVRRLQDLSLSNCHNLVNLPESICNLRFLKYLNVNFCSKLEKFPQNLGSLQCLEIFGAAGFDLNHVQEAIQSDVCYMSPWEASNVSINYFSSIPDSIIQLSKLRALDLSHCQKLLQIPELPPSLRILDVHACPCLETLSSPSIVLAFSLFRCFKSAIQEFECGSNRSPGIAIVIPGKSGIPEWISQQKKGSQITIELPVDWYQNNDFLGFALYSVYVPLHIESKEYPCSLKCELNFHGHRYEFPDDLPSKFWLVGELSFTGWYSCCHNGGESNRVWVAYYPKVAITNDYWSNEWRQLEASFHGFFGHKRLKVEECGFHLIYMPKIANRTNPQDTNIKGVRHNHAPMIQYLDVQTSCGTKSVVEDVNVNAQRSCDDTQRMDQDDDVDDNVVDAQDDEEDHMQNCSELLFEFDGNVSS